jgi:GNAT superfamily N-acetyltransferase
MNRSEIDIAVDWAAAEGWNPGICDADCFRQADHTGFLGGWIGDEPVATISAIRYGRSFGFLGFYIVNPKYRGKGYGLAIWNAGLDYLEGRTIGLDGVVAQQDNYRRSGFTLAYNNIRYEGTGGGRNRIPSGIAAIPLDSVPKTKLYRYDRTFFPEERTAFLDCWTSRPGTISLGILNNDQLAGVGIARRCRTGFKVGPLFADSPDIAEALFSSIRSAIPDTEPVFLDVPSVNADALALSARHNMRPVFETARMYKGNAPEISVDRTYGITSFELG